MEGVGRRAPDHLSALRSGLVGRRALPQLDMGEVRRRHLHVELGRVGLGAPEGVLLLLERQRGPVVHVVDPALGDAVAAALAGLAVVDDAAVLLVLGLGIAGAVDVAGEVEAVLVDEGRGLAGHGHVAGQGAARGVLHLPDHVLVRAVDPEQQLLLGSLGLLGAVGRVVARVGLEVVGLDPQRVTQGRAEEQAQLHPLGGGIGLGGLQRALDVVEISAVDAAHMGVPLVLPEVGQDRRLRSCHRYGSSWVSLVCRVGLSARTLDQTATTKERQPGAGPSTRSV